MKKTITASSTTTTTPSSSSSSLSTVKSGTTAMEEDRSESCYYPGCRKDANCNCDMCLDSINATLDLMPFSVQKTSLTKFSSRPNNNNSSVERTPISFDASVLSTPKWTTPKLFQVSLDQRPSGRLDFEEIVVEKEKKMKRGFGFYRWWKLVLG